MNENNPKVNNVFFQTADRVAEVFPYFFIVYVFIQLVGLFYDSLYKYLNLVGFTSAIILLGVISLSSPRFRSEGLPFFIKKLIYAQNWLLGYRYRSFLVVFFVSFCAYFGADMLELLVAAFGVIAVVFLLDSRFSGGLALALLAFCPILIFFNLNSLAETVAVYIYYFLVITVISGLASLKIYPQEDH